MALGRTVEELHATLGQSAYERWRVYWETEPWGPWRDNLHTALLAREIRRPYLRPGTRTKLEEFFYRRPIERLRQANAGLWAALKAMAKRSPKNGGSSEASRKA